LSEAERQQIGELATPREFRELAPSQIVPVVAERGIYVASESSLYRVLRHRKLLTHRERSLPRQHRRPAQQVATGPNQVWSWDISYLRSAVRGQCFFLYLVVDVWSRKIVAWEVALQESSAIAAEMIRRATMENGVDGTHLMIHSDNGGPMKGATLLATLQAQWVVPSFSGPRVYDDNPYSEALFRTLKYRLYVIVAALASFSGVLAASRYGAGDPRSGTQFEFDVILAIILGGTSLKGGKGSVLGTLLGALVVAVLDNGLNILNVLTFWQSIVKGVILVMAILLNEKVLAGARWRALVRAAT